MVIKTKRPPLADGITTFFLILLFYILAVHLPLDPGVSWHVTAAQRMLEGGNYLTNLFDDSTPITFALFIPLIWFHQWLGGYWPAVIPVYVYCLYALSFCAGYTVLLKHYSNDFRWRPLYYSILLSTLFFSLLILGQRESIVIAFLLPYLLMISTSPRQETSKTLPWLIGLLAALAVAQIPIYLLVILTVDILSALQCRKGKGSYLLKTQAIFYSSFALIMLTSYLIYPSYFTTALSLTLCFESGYNTTISTLILFSLPSLIILTIQILYLFSHHNRHPITINFLILGWLFLLIYYIQQKSWYYHLYPLYILLILIVTLNLCQKKTTPLSTFKGLVTKTALISMLFIAVYFTSEILFSSINQALYFPKAKRFFHTINQFSKNKKMLTFITQLEPTYPLAHYTEAKIVTPWSNTWLIPKWVNTTNPQQSICLFQKGTSLFYQQTINILTKEKPELIMFNAQKNIPYIQQENFDMLAFLKKNPTLKKLLSPYEKLTDVRGFRFLKRHNHAQF